MALLLGGIKPLPTWLCARLNYAYKQQFKAMKTKDQRRLAWAQREIAKLREKAGI